MLFSLSSKRHMSLCPCCVPPVLCVVVFCSFMYPLSWTDALSLLLPAFLPSFLPSSLLHFSTGLPFAFIVIVFRFSLSLLFFPFITSQTPFFTPSPARGGPLVPSALHSFVWSPASYPQHIRCSTNESRERKGESATLGRENRGLMKPL